VMTDFAEAALKVDPLKRWITLPEGVSFMGDATLGGIMLVRDAYKRLYDCLETNAVKGGYFRAVVSGNPGLCLGSASTL
jgi:hypothetical protein